MSKRQERLVDNPVNTDEERIRIAALNENLPKVQAFVGDALRKAGAGEMALLNTELAVEEVFVNIASYAYKEKNGFAEISVRVTEHGECAKICFADEGEHFDPLSVPEPDITLSSEERQIGGLGIFLLRQLAEDVDYSYKDRKNVLCFSMRLV